MYCTITNFPALTTAGLHTAPQPVTRRHSSWSPTQALGRLKPALLLRSGILQLNCHRPWYTRVFFGTNRIYCGNLVEPWSGVSALCIANDDVSFEQWSTRAHELVTCLLSDWKLSTQWSNWSGCIYLYFFRTENVATIASDIASSNLQSVSLP